MSNPKVTKETKEVEWVLVNREKIAEKVARCTDEYYLRRINAMMEELDERSSNRENPKAVKLSEL